MLWFMVGVIILGEIVERVKKGKVETFRLRGRTAVLSVSEDDMQESKEYQYVM